MPSVFFSYSHHDEALRDQLEVQLAMLKHQGIIEAWHDRRIGAGQDLDDAIDAHVRSDEIILLLISPDFIASPYCYAIEARTAMERHASGDAIVIPVILRPCDWHPAPFGRLNATPPDGKPVTLWPNQDQAFLEVARAVRAAAQRLQPEGSAGRTAPPASSPAPEATAPPASPPPRSSNLRLSKHFTQRDKDAYRLEAFAFMAQFFEQSLIELGARNDSYEGVFRRHDGGRFFAAVYRDGAAVARGTVFLGSGAGLGQGIHYRDDETTADNSFNESLSIEADDQRLYLAPFGMAMMGQSGREKLSVESAAEHFWSLLIAPLQRS